MSVNGLFAIEEGLHDNLLLCPGSDADETKVKEETGATLRCIPFEQKSTDLTCFFTGHSASEIGIFAKAH